MERADFLTNLPRADLHVDLVGTLSAELFLTLSERHNIPLPYDTIDQVHTALQYAAPDGFHALYALGKSLLKESQDFFDATKDYLANTLDNTVTHIEFYLDHEHYSVGNIDAIIAAHQEHNVPAHIILSLDAIDQLNELKKAQQKKLSGIHLKALPEPTTDFSKINIPLALSLPKDLEDEQHLEILKMVPVTRLHSQQFVASNMELIDYYFEQKIALVTDPISDLRLGFLEQISDSPVQDLLDDGLCLSLGSHAPAYLGANLAMNYTAIAQALDLDNGYMAMLARNSFSGSLLSEKEKLASLSRISDYCDAAIEEPET